MLPLTLSCVKYFSINKSDLRNGYWYSTKDLREQSKQLDKLRVNNLIELAIRVRENFDFPLRLAYPVPIHSEH